MKETDISSDFVSSFDPGGDNSGNTSDSIVVSHAKSKLPEISDFNRLERLSNEGTTCHTYKWEWCSRVYFVKRLKPEFLHSPQHLHAFEKEYELGSRLSHSSLPRYVDLRHTKKECYIVMEYIDGKTLEELWHKPITADRRMTYRIMNQLIDVLEYLHRNNIMHYDLLPQNVMLTAGTNNVMLIDLDKAFNSTYAKNHGDPSRFDLDVSDGPSSDVDFRGIGLILTKGLWGGMDYGELKHFNNLCNKPGVTAEELREALAHKYDDIHIDNQICIKGRTCDGYEGDWQLRPVMIKRLHSNLCDNKYYLDKFKEEFEIMSDSNDPTFAYYLLIRNTSNDNFIAIEKPDGMPVAEMMKQEHLWIYDLENVKHLLSRLLSSFFYLWTEGLDAFNFEVEDIFVNPSDGEIKIANFREVLDASVDDTKERWTASEVKTVSASGEVIYRETAPLPNASRRMEVPQLARIIRQMEQGGVDMYWLADFRQACMQGASYRELSKILDNSRPY